MPCLSQCSGLSLLIALLLFTGCLPPPSILLTQAPAAETYCNAADPYDSAGLYGHGGEAWYAADRACTADSLNVLLAHPDVELVRITTSDWRRIEARSIVVRYDSVSTLDQRITWGFSLHDRPTFWESLERIGVATGVGVGIGIGLGAVAALANNDARAIVRSGAIVGAIGFTLGLPLYGSDVQRTYVRTEDPAYWRSRDE